MKSVIPGLLAIGERVLTNSHVVDSLLASNHDEMVDAPVRERGGLGEAISDAASGVGLGAAAAPAGVRVELPERAAAVVVGGAEERADHEEGHDHDEHEHEHEHEHEEGHDHEHVDGICEGLLSEQEWLATQGSEEAGLSGNGDVVLGAPLLALDQTFRLHSNPGASKTIYLDFNGHTTTGTAWNTWNNGALGSSFYSPAFDTDANKAVFSDTELALIQRAWQRVAIDFAAFDVNVTTQEPLQDWLIKSSSTDLNYGIRTVITSYGPSSGSAGGIGYIDSFNWNSDTPAFVYNTSLLGVSEAISHEVGHTLGLSHDGTFDAATNTSVGYYSGHGSGETGWAPIMGAGYYQNVTAWDDGTYYNSNNGGTGANYGKGADDLAVITGYNGFSYLADQVGGGLADAASLNINAGVVSQFATIETRSDVDVFRFDLVDVGAIELWFDPYVYRAFVDSDGLWGGEAVDYYAGVSDADSRTSYVDHGSNLDLAVSLLNASGSVVANGTSALLGLCLAKTNLAAGTYYVRVDGVGSGDPLSSTPSGYSDYASIGNYLMKGTVSGAGAAVVAPVITLSLSQGSVLEDGSSNLVYTFTRSVVTADPLSVNFSVGGSAFNGYDYTGLLPGTSLVTFAANAATATLVLDPTADGTVEVDETVSVTLASGLGYTVGTSGAVVGTIVNDDVVAATPVITLSLTPGSVTEDGASNLVYTFSRSVVTGSSLSVNVTVGGTATNGSDYTGLVAGSTQTVTFAANAATATLVVNPTADSTVESDETVSLKLAAGSGYTVGTVDAVTGVIVNDDPQALALAFTAAADSLTGGTSADTFQLNRLSDALWSGTPDRITNLQAGTDVIDSSTISSSVRARQLGGVSSLDAAGIGRVLTSKAFGRGSVATFTYNDLGGVRTFLAVNDMTSGFNASSDSVMEITGFSGSLSALTLI